jgi:hypothetical protein
MGRIFSGFALFIGLFLGSVAYATPHLGAYACPRCYGFVRVAPQIYVDSAADENQINSALKNLAGANEQVLDFYPDRASRPRWIFCLSKTCGDRFGKGPLAMAYLSAFIFVYPDGATTPILAHEIAHAELHKRVGMVRFLAGAVPAWFDEGLAVYISRDSRYIRMDRDTVVGCNAARQIEPPSSAKAFRRLGERDAHAIYTASACKVTQWLETHNGVQGVIQMGEAVRNGSAFSG